MDESGESPSPFRTAWWYRLGHDASTFELTRFAILRLLGGVYLAAFASLALQFEPLFGSGGLLPAASFLAANRAHSGASALWKLPTLFWLDASDGTMRAAALCGVVLAVAVVLGVTHVAVQLALWILYGSFVHVGQIFFSYGWELQLLETGLLAVFLCPVRTLGPKPRSATPQLAMWLFRWLIFRVMIGAALIKLRNDPCWRDLTCLDFHFETQPNPNPVSWLFHHAPHAVHAPGVAFNHFVELIVPWFVVGPRRIRHAAGALLVSLQALLILSGNLSFLNWLTIVPALACFDDSWFVAMARWTTPAQREAWLARLQTVRPSLTHQRAVAIFAGLIFILSFAPVANLFSSHQEMNAAYDPLDIVNTYGAFGSVDRQRYEAILEGSLADSPDEGNYQEYALPCMPGDPRRPPCVVTPYHYRLDWQMWFVGNGAARGMSIGQDPWLVHLVWQLLEGKALPKRLFASDPFPDRPPRWIRIVLWKYSLSSSLGERVWWTRTRIGEWLPPVSLEDPELRDFVRAYGWPDAPAR